MDYKNDFPMLNKDIVYFDNAATTFKPSSVINKMNDYYTKYTSNAHRGEYILSYIVDEEINESREVVKKYINAKEKEEIIFTAGTTDSINLIVNGFFTNVLNKGDEVILTKSEHASNILPWLILKNKKGIKVKYIPLDEDGNISIDEYKKIINKRTKVVSLAHITNVLGDKRDIKKIIDIAKNNNIYVIVDAAQSIAHTKTDVQDLNCDFLAFSFHKMYGPTGVGVLYGKKELLSKIMPPTLGGGMNEVFNDNKIILKALPERLEAGTQNISGIIASKEAIKYIEKIGIENIEKKELELKKYLVDEMKKLDFLRIYNKNTPGAILVFNVKGKAPSDVALYLNSKKICVRAGMHCVKMLEEEKGFTDTIRISLCFYNTKEEIDYLIKVLSDKKRLYDF